MDKINQKIQKSVFNTIILIALAIGIIVLSNSFRSNRDLDAEKLNKYFKTKVEYVSNSLLSNNFPQDITDQIFLENPFYDDWKVRLFDRGELVWWKDASLYDNATTLDQVQYDYQTKRGYQEIAISFPLTSVNRDFIQRKYIKDANCDYNYQVKINSDFKLKNEKQQLGISATTTKNINIQVLRFLSILFILLFFLVYVYLFQLFEFDTGQITFCFLHPCHRFSLYSISS